MTIAVSLQDLAGKVAPRVTNIGELVSLGKMRGWVSIVPLGSVVGCITATVIDHKAVCGRP
jgi:hypothetical protein